MKSLDRLRRHHPSVRRSWGFSLLELLVGLTIGLWILLGAGQLFTDQLASHRAHLRELRLQQELRTVMDIMVRDLRRAGHWDDALQGITPTGTTHLVDNPFAPLLIEERGSLASIEYSYQRTSVTSSNQFGFRRRLDGDGIGHIQMKNAGGGWQPLTDPAAVNVTQLRITPTTRTIELWPQCPCRYQLTRSSDCHEAILSAHAERPRMLIRQITVLLSAAARNEQNLRRDTRTTIHLPNHTVINPNGCPPA